MNKMKEEFRTINVSKELAARIKVYCTERGLKIKYWVNKVIMDALNNISTPQDK